MTRSGLAGLLILVGLLATIHLTPLSAAHISSGSMAPTLHDGDLVVTSTATDPTVGDIIVYYSPTEQSYVAHRIVEQTDAGYITKGDTNPRTDQATGAAPVSDSRIAATVVTVGGSPLAIPALGTWLTTLPVGWLAALLGLGAIVRHWRRTDTTRTTRRGTYTYRRVALAALLVSWAVATGAVMATAATHTVGVTATSTTVDAPTTVHVGETTVRTVEYGVRRLPGVQYHLTATNADIQHTRIDQQQVVTTFETHPFDTMGRYTVTIRIYAYPQTLPDPAIRTLHALHPAAAAGSTVGVLFLPFAALSWALFSLGATVRLATSRWGRWVQRRWQP